MCACSDFVAATCPWDMSLLLFPMCVRAVILSLLHISTTSACNMSLCVYGMRVCHCYISLGHIPATFPCTCFDSVPATCLCYTCLQHAPPCAQNVILLLLHVPGTCPCILSLYVWPLRVNLGRFWVYMYLLVNTYSNSCFYSSLVWTLTFFFTIFNKLLTGLHFTATAWRNPVTKKY